MSLSLTDDSNDASSSSSSRYSTPRRPIPQNLSMTTPSFSISPSSSSSSPSPIKTIKKKLVTKSRSHRKKNKKNKVTEEPLHWIKTGNKIKKISPPPPPPPIPVASPSQALSGTSGNSIALTATTSAVDTKQERPKLLASSSSFKNKELQEEEQQEDVPKSPQVTKNLPSKRVKSEQKQQQQQGSNQTSRPLMKRMGRSLRKLFPSSPAIHDKKSNPSPQPPKHEDDFTSTSSSSLDQLIAVNSSPPPPLTPSQTEEEMNNEQGHKEDVILEDHDDDDSSIQSIATRSSYRIGISRPNDYKNTTGNATDDALPTTSSFNTAILASSPFGSPNSNHYHSLHKSFFTKEGSVQQKCTVRMIHIPTMLQDKTTCLPMKMVPLPSSLPQTKPSQVRANDTTKPTNGSTSPLPHQDTTDDIIDLQFDPPSSSTPIRSNTYTSDQPRNNNNSEGIADELLQLPTHIPPSPSIHHTNHHHPVTTTTTTKAMTSIPVKIFVLLLQPSERIFELIQIVFDPNHTTIGDLLDSIHINASEPRLAKQLYRGFVRPYDYDDENHSTELVNPTVYASVSPINNNKNNNNNNSKNVADIRRGEILIAIPHSCTTTTTGKHCRAFAVNILKHPKLIRLLNRSDPLAPFGKIPSNRHGTNKGTTTNYNYSEIRKTLFSPPTVPEETKEEHHSYDDDNHDYDDDAAMRNISLNEDHNNNDSIPSASSLMEEGQDMHIRDMSPHSVADTVAAKIFATKMEQLINTNKKNHNNNKEMNENIEKNNKNNKKNNNDNNNNNNNILQGASLLSLGNDFHYEESSLDPTKQIRRRRRSSAISISTATSFETVDIKSITSSSTRPFVENDCTKQSSTTMTTTTTPNEIAMISFPSRRRSLSDLLEEIIVFITTFFSINDKQEEEEEMRRKIDQLRGSPSSSSSSRPTMKMKHHPSPILIMFRFFSTVMIIYSLLKWSIIIIFSTIFWMGGTLSQIRQQWEEGGGHHHDDPLGMSGFIISMGIFVCLIYFQQRLLLISSIKQTKKKPTTFLENEGRRVNC